MEIRKSLLTIVFAALAFANMPLTACADDKPSTATPTATTSPSPSVAPTPSPGPTTTPTESKAADPNEKAKNRVYVDEDYDIRIPAPEGWFRTIPRYYTVAGDLFRVWSPGTTTSIMVYRFTDPETVYIPLTLLDVTAESLVEKREAEVLEQEVRTVSGKQAAWLVTVGLGTGGAIDGKGNIRTLQHMVAIPRVDDVIVCMYVGPEEESDKYRPVFEEVLKNVEIGGEQTEAQKNSR